MNKVYLLVVAFFLASCATKKNTQSENQVAGGDAQVASPLRSPSASDDLSGAYLGEGLFSKRTTGLKRPAFRIYLQRAEGEADTYYGVVLEYDQLLNMALPYLASQKAPIFNHVVGYLDAIATRISAYKFVPGQKRGKYDAHNLFVRNGQIVPEDKATLSMSLDLDSKSKNPLAGAVISGLQDGPIVIPDDTEKTKGGFLSGIGEALNLTQFKLASVVYDKGHLASTWRGNWNDLEGSYLSEYGRVKDGVLELYTRNGQAKMKFIKTNKTKAKYFTNPKSGSIEGDYIVTEPIPKMYILTPVSNAKTASDKEMTPRIGLFLDVFDASAPEAGGHMVTEIAFTNPQDPEDFMMYYEHPEHAKNVGVEPK